MAISRTNAPVVAMTIDADLLAVDHPLRRTDPSTDNYLMGVKLAEHFKKLKPMTERSAWCWATSRPTTSTNVPPGPATRFRARRTRNGCRREWMEGDFRLPAVYQR
jgi:hypothetical protein